MSSSLRRWSPPARHILGHTRLPDVDAELEEFAMHPRCAQSGLARLIARIKRRTSSGTVGLPRELAISNANSSKPRSVPTDHGGWLDDRQCVVSSRQPPKQADEYQPIDAAEAWSIWRRPPQDVDLLAQRQVLRHKGYPQPK
jgi:hypothetical protein